MNKERIKQLWNDCELDITKFAEAIRAEALEEAAKVCDEEAKSWFAGYDEEISSAKMCAAAIRRLK